MIIKSRTTGLLVVVWVSFVAWVVWGFVVVRTIERPRYTVIERRADYEVRQYAPYLVAQVQMKGPWSRSLAQGTRSILDYLTGANTTQSSITATIASGIQPRAEHQYIAPTAPVVQEEKNDSFLISLILPSRYTLDTVPLPDNPEIRLVQIASTTAAVMSFSGSAGQDTVNAHGQRLRTLLESDNRVILSPARLTRYSSPWTPEFLRQNEILFTIR